ncbi:CDP-alcohol phosphatidyltransferase family protein [Candidatus Mycalebacterium sp.]
MTDALIVACGTGFQGESLEDFLEVPVSGLTQVRRLVRSCLKSGIDDITVVSTAPESTLRRMLPESVSGEAKITFTVPGTVFAERDRRGKVLILQSNLFFQMPLLEKFIKENPSTGGAVLMKTSEDDSASEKITKPLGAAIVEPEAVADLLEDCNLSRWVGRYRMEGITEYEPPKDLYAIDLGIEPLSEARRLIASTVGKTSTGWIAKNLNGKLSLPISLWLARGTSLTPNQISVLTNIVAGVPCIIAYLTGHPVYGAVFMQIAAILDRCDGEVARLKLLETKRGEWVDTISDQLTIGGFVISVPVGYYLHGNNEYLAFWLGFLNLSIFLFFLVWSFIFMVRYTKSGSLVSYHRIDELVGDASLSPVRRLMAFLRPVMRRNFYSLAFLLFAAVGGYPWVLVVTTMGLVGIFLHQLEDIFRIRGRIPRKES